MAKSVFISHVSAEAPVAEALKSWLEQALPGVTAFASSVDIALGAAWLGQIEKSLDSADAVLVLCSRWSVARPWVNFESGAGWGRGKPVVPLCHGSMKAENLPDLFQSLQGQNIQNAWDCRGLIERMGRELDCAPRTGIDYDEMAAALRPKPPPRQSLIALDLSHGQEDWPRPPDEQRPPADQSIFGYLQSPAAGRIYPLTSVRHFGSKPFWEASGLILAHPLNTKIGSDIVDIIIQWVFGGGRLLLLGYEFGDVHHGGNLCDVANQFGIQLHTDIVGPPGFEGSKPYDAPVRYVVSEADRHPFTGGLSEITLTNTQTLSVCPGGTEWLRLGSKNVVYRPRPDTVDYVNFRLIQRFGQHCVPVPHTEGLPVAVEAPPGLCGNGKVCAIGTWQIRNQHAETGILFHRLLEWLADVPVNANLPLAAGSVT
jgi:hypothetical protein